MSEAAASIPQGIDDFLINEDSGDGRVAGSQGFPHDLHVWGDIVGAAFGLPGVVGAGAAEAAHYFVVHEEGAVAVADGFHGCEVAWYGGHAAECLRCAIVFSLLGFV